MLFVIPIALRFVSQVHVRSRFHEFLKLAGVTKDGTGLLHQLGIRTSNAPCPTLSLCALQSTLITPGAGA